MLKHIKGQSVRQSTVIWCGQSKILTSFLTVLIFVKNVRDHS